ncbi:isochorismate synthase [Luteimonas sp. 100069]|uniref:isochorismate synthase n=1 Tax=Luteimonas sp. 100069 TaxID=2006109 RepID=UPI000F51054B|nr:isochorismate synthase [Luteimonas sp. 100069]RPD88210.1 isochorismate synthase [Luteimonas sp. 100069]
MTAAARPLAPATMVDDSDNRFRLHAPGRSLATDGVQARLPAGPTATLGARVAAFFAAPRPGPDLLVGALPFDPHHDDAIYQPLRSVPATGPQSTQSVRLIAASEQPAAADYAAAVARCVEGLRAAPDSDEALRKVVLARGLRMEADVAIDPHALAVRLGHDASVTTYVVPLPVAPGDAPAWLVGATPELLVSRRGRNIVSHPLAGSARRDGDSVRDRARTDALLASAKDLREHRFVVEAILDGLAPLCSRLQAPARPALLATETMWHLATRITGTLKDPDVSSAMLAGLLHPTPAVCGTPRMAALQAIRELEPFDRGFYAGAVGWTDASGDGDWYVSIRCARVQDNAMHLFAGAGIVADSVPALEVDETAGKFMALRNALGIDGARA